MKVLSTSPDCDRTGSDTAHGMAAEATTVTGLNETVVERLAQLQKHFEALAQASDVQMRVRSSLKWVSKPPLLRANAAKTLDGCAKAAGCARERS
jgi:hypothetical protein